MRRYVLILMMLILPLQWSWSVAASICQHETTGAQAHLGHHVHEHVNASSEQAVGAPGADTVPPYDADCGTCHGQGSLAITAAAALPLPDVDAPTPGALTRHLPDPAPDSLLRPPLSHLV